MVDAAVCVGHSLFMDQPLRESIVGHLRRQINEPQLLAIYAFGSRIVDGGSYARFESDLDLAVLVAGYVEPLRLWQLSAETAQLLNCDVDLIDLRAASTVLQHEVVMSGERWWCSDPLTADLFEVMVMREKVSLNEARAGLLEDIRLSGSVYDR